MCMGKLVGGAVLSLIVALSAAGLTTPVAAQQVLTVAAFPAVDEIVRASIPEWKKRFPNVEIKVVSRQFADHHTAMTTALSTSFYLPDVMALEVGYVGRFAQGFGLEDLSKAPYSVQQYQSLFVPYAFAQATNRRGAIVAVPSDIGPGTLLYRSDILTKAGVSQSDLTRSWDGYVASGIRIKAKTGAYLVAHARDVKDIVIRAGIKPGEGLYFDGQSNVLVNTPRFHRAFELAREVRRQKLDAKVSAWSNEWAEGFKRGTLATQLTGAWLAGHLNNWLAPATKGNWRASELPEGAAAAYGGAFFAIAKGAPAANKPLSWELIKLLTLTKERQLEAFMKHDAFPALLAAHDHPFYEEPLEFLGGQKARVLWRDAATKILPNSVHRQDSFADEVINTELDKVLDRGKDIGLALADAQRLLEKRAKR